MRSVILVCFLLLTVTTAMAGVKVPRTVWVVELTCQSNEPCYAASNGSFTYSISNAKTFVSTAQAQAFMASLTSSLESKNPRIIQHSEYVCVESTHLTEPGC